MFSRTVLGRILYQILVLSFKNFIPLTFDDEAPHRRTGRVVVFLRRHLDGLSFILVGHEIVLVHERRFLRHKILESGSRCGLDGGCLKRAGLRASKRFDGAS